MEIASNLVTKRTNDALGFAFVAATAIHAFILLAISFDISREKPPIPERTLDITLVQPKAKPKQPVENPDFLAQQSQQATSNNRFMTWVNGNDFESGFYFPNVESDQIDLEFVIEGSEDVWIRRIQAFAHPDVIYREFENGLVVANPSPRPYVFDLDKFFPVQTFRRLKGSPMQDPACNDGSIVQGQLNIGPKEGIFLIKTN